MGGISGSLIVEADGVIQPSWSDFYFISVQTAARHVATPMTCNALPRDYLRSCVVASQTGP